MKPAAKALADSLFERSQNYLREETRARRQSADLTAQADSYRERREACQHLAGQSLTLEEIILALEVLTEHDEP